MKNVRPELIKTANKIVDEHLKSGEELSTLVSKYASMESLNDSLVHRLVAETNKQYILKTGNQEFSLADASVAMSGLTKYKKASENVEYSFPEFSGAKVSTKTLMKFSQPESVVKQASIDLLPLLKTASEKDLMNLKKEINLTKVASEDICDKMKSVVDTIKRCGFTLQDYKEKYASENDTVVDFLFEENKSIASPNSRWRIDHEKVFSELQGLNKTASESISNLKSLHEKYTESVKANENILSQKEVRVNV